MNTLLPDIQYPIIIAYPGSVSRFSSYDHLFYPCIQTIIKIDVA